MTFWRRWIKRLPGSDASRLARRETKRAAKKALTKGGRDDSLDTLLKPPKLRRAKAMPTDCASSATHCFASGNMGKRGSLAPAPST